MELQDGGFDLGTGPFCVLALTRRRPVEKVYAVEANQKRREGPRLHREVRGQCFEEDVDGLVPLEPGLLEVAKGFSTELTYREVDLR